MTDWRGAWEPGASGQRGVFVTTRWDLVRAAAGQPGEEPPPAAGSAGQALAELCRIYRPPVLAFLLRQRCPPPDAEDLTQEFFALFARGALLGRANQEKGRFRAFLLSALKQFLADAADHARTLKRGGACRFVPLLPADGAGRGETDADALDPEHLPAHKSAFPAELLFDLCWARTLVSRSLAELREEFHAKGEEVAFQALRPFLETEADAAEILAAARRLELTPGAVTTRLHRFRRRYGERLWQEVARTVAAPDEIEGELRHLLRVLAAAA